MLSAQIFSQSSALPPLRVAPALVGLLQDFNVACFIRHGCLPFCSRCHQTAGTRASQRQAPVTSIRANSGGTPIRSGMLLVPRPAVTIRCRPPSTIRPWDQRSGARLALRHDAQAGKLDLAAVGVAGERQERPGRHVREPHRIVRQHDRRPVRRQPREQGPRLRPDAYGHRARRRTSMACLSNANVPRSWSSTAMPCARSAAATSRSP